MLLPFPGMVKNRVFAISVVARTTSTQDVVRRAALAGAPDGFCCLAGEQNEGRGRLGRRWVAPPGTALLTSVLLRVADGAASGVPFAAGLALRDALAETCGLQAGLKWPNDVLVGGRKLAGLLAEVCPEAGGAGRIAVIVGAGVNLSVPAFPEGVAGVSLHELGESPPGAESLLDAWLRRLDVRVTALERDGLAALLGDWRLQATGLGGPVRVSTGGRVIAGTAIDVRDDGALLVRTAAGLTPVLAGDVQLLAEPDQSAPMRER